ncbi:MAG TPA: hypothetical protein VK469_06705 [Candidatus Kapabacteria bacterium]|nr:hypothetical protein [Candidatus Kapabacteria bacterium]
MIKGQPNFLPQTGYLTIKKHEGETYVLSYPNREVENAFLYNLVEEFSGK